MSRGKRFTEQELEYIKVHSQDMTISEIATALGRNYWAIQRVMQNKLGENLTDGQIATIEKMKDEHSVYKIAKELGVGYATVYGYLIRRINVKQNHMFTKEDRVKYIATRLGVTEQQVYNRAKKLGVKKTRRV